MGNQARRFALAAVVLGMIGGMGRVVDAGFIVLSSPAGLSSGDATTDPYSGTSGTFYPNPFIATGGGNTLAFTVAGMALSRFDADGVEEDFAAGTHLLSTDDASGVASGPLTIAFTKGVSEFGLMAQSIGFDTETLMYTAYDGSVAIGSYTSPATDNTTGAGTALFLGGQATNSDMITSVVVSSVSSTEVSTNDFFVGPVTFGPSAVPEPSSLALCGIAGIVGLAVARVRRKHLA
jgi:PEP-CTERM motif